MANTGFNRRTTTPNSQPTTTAVRYVPPSRDLPWPIAIEAVDLVAETEGLKLHAYKCPAGVWTIGRGRTKGVREGMTCTLEQADQWLLEDLSEFANGVLRRVTVHPNQNQLGAMTSLAYNVGLANFERSTVRRAHNAGDVEAASRAFGLWNKARDPETGQLQELRGLTRRRALEAALYLKPVSAPVSVEPAEAPELAKAPVLIVEELPQAVEPERGMGQSQIVIASGAAMVASLSGVAVEVSQRLAQVRDALGDWAAPFLLGCVAALAGYVIWQRVQQRRKGWA